MLLDKQKTGSEVFDSLLNGGFERDVITTIYGPAGSGKTTLCLLSAIEVVRQGKKVLFIDTEGGFSIERFCQLAEDYEKLLPNIIIIKPTTFAEQRDQFAKLKELVTDNVGLIVVDTIAMLYRSAIGNDGDVKQINYELGLQISYLSQISRKHEIPVIVTNQVYADFNERESVKMVGGDLLKYGSKCLIELQKFRTKRKAVLRKHRSIQENKEALFEIRESGFLEVTLH